MDGSEAVRAQFLGEIGQSLAVDARVVDVGAHDDHRHLHAVRRCLDLAAEV
jgi:hypothetical protein